MHSVESKDNLIKKGEVIRYRIDFGETYVVTALVDFTIDDVNFIKGKVVTLFEAVRWLENYYTSMFHQEEMFVLASLIERGMVAHCSAKKLCFGEPEGDVGLWEEGADVLEAIANAKEYSLLYLGEIK